MAEKKQTVAERSSSRTARTTSSTRRLPAAKKLPERRPPTVRRSAARQTDAQKPDAQKPDAQRPAANRPAGKRTGAPAARKTSAAKQDGVPAGDSVVVALEVWRSVVRALRQAKYDEVGPAYAKLSTLLVQQRTADLLAEAPDRAEWAELSATAQEAVELLEPVMTAARQLVTLPSRVDLDRETLAASTDAAHTGRPARRRASTT